MGREWIFWEIQGFMYTVTHDPRPWSFGGISSCLRSQSKRDDATQRVTKPSTPSPQCRDEPRVFEPGADQNAKPSTPATFLVDENYGVRNDFVLLSIAIQRTWVEF